MEVVSSQKKLSEAEDSPLPIEPSRAEACQSILIDGPKLRIDIGRLSWYPHIQDNSNGKARSGNFG